MSRGTRSAITTSRIGRRGKTEVLPPGAVKSPEKQKTPPDAAASGGAFQLLLSVHAGDQVEDGLALLDGDGAGGGVRRAVGVNANDSALLKNVSGKTKAELGSDAFAQLLNDNAARMADAVAEVNAYLETLQERGFVHKNDYTGNDLLTWRAQDDVVGFFAEPAPELPFDDVAAGSWYYDDVAYVFAKGIMVGTGGGHFSPAVATTRGMVVTMPYEYARYKGYDVTKAADLSGFVDQGSVSDFAVGPMQWAVAQELIFGVGGNAIAPSWLQCCTVFAKCSPEHGTYICSRHGGASIRMRPCFAPRAEKV